MPNLYSSATVQATIATLQSTYDSLAGRLSTSYSHVDRSVTFQKMREVREELTYWKGILAQIDSSYGVTGRSRPDLSSWK